MAPFRCRLKARGAHLLTPSKGIDATLLSRREQRLHEMSALHRALGMASARQRRSKQRRRQDLGAADISVEDSGEAALSPLPQQQQQQGQQASPQRPAARPGAAKKAARREPAAQARNSGASSPSSLTVVAPDWPPVKAAPAASPSKKGAAQEQQQQQRKPRRQQEPPEGAAAAALPNGGAAATGGRSSSKADVRQFLQQASGGRAGMAGVAQWDTVDADTKRQHDRMLHQAAPKRKRPDEYDMEYDQGRVKKVRSKAAGGEGGGAQLDATAFDSTWQERQRGGGRDTNPVQLRGKKKRRQQEQQQQRAQRRPPPRR